MQAGIGSNMPAWNNSGMIVALSLCGKQRRARNYKFSGGTVPDPVHMHTPSLQPVGSSTHTKSQSTPFSQLHVFMSSVHAQDSDPSGLPEVMRMLVICPTFILLSIRGLTFTSTELPDFASSTVTTPFCLSTAVTEQHGLARTPGCGVCAIAAGGASKPSANVAVSTIT